MSNHENTMGLQHGNERFMNCPSSGFNTNVSEIAVSSMSMAKPSDAANLFLGSSIWDPVVSLSQSQSFGGSSLVSHEFSDSSYHPLVLENQGMSSTSHLVQYMSDSNFSKLILEVPSFGSGSFSEMIGSISQIGCGDIANAGYRPIERSPVNDAQSPVEDSTTEEGATGSAPNGSKRKRELHYSSSFCPNKNAEGEAVNDSSGNSIDGVKGPDEKKPKTEQNASADLPGKQFGKQAKDSSQRGEGAKENFIHVRARRGQATNSHSLAERVRREKISERMRLLQELVPGCNKITGKAVMLDEIINYVQSLQQQVEFLSMKLATVNPELNLDVDKILSKDILQSHVRSGGISGYGSGINSSHLFPNGTFHGTLPGLPSTWSQFPPLPQTMTSKASLEWDTTTWHPMGD